MKKADKAATSDLAALDWQKLSVDETVQRLNVAPQLGLETAAISRRQQQHGKNAIPPKRVNWPRKVRRLQQVFPADWAGRLLAFRRLRQLAVRTSARF